MKSFVRQARDVIAGLLEKPSPFSKSVILSVGLHLLLLSVFGFVVGLFDTPSFYKPPLVFDFVFSPTEEVQHAGEMQSETKAAKVDKPKEGRGELETTKPDGFESPEPSAPKQPLANATPEPNELVPDKATFTEAAEPSYVPEADIRSRLANRYEVTTVTPSSLSLPSRAALAPNRIPAKLAMTNEQREMLYKKLRKWSEKFNRNEWADSLVVWEHDGKVYSARFRHLPGQSETDIDEVAIDILTHKDGYSLSTEMHMKRLAFSNFAQFVDYWDPRVAVHDDVLEGRFHSNTRFNVSSSFGVAPKFHGKVTTSSYEISSSGSLPFFKRESVFLGGLETGVKEIRLPKRFLPFLEQTNIPRSHSHILSEDTEITFRADGSYTWKLKDTPEKPQRRQLPEDSFYIIGREHKELHIKGAVNGKVLVYSPEKIVIDGDLRYAAYPEIDSDSDDYLGLVCDKDIEVAEPEVTGPGDLYIHAAIFAKGRFRVPHLGGNRGDTLYIYGSMTAGSLSATEPRYATHVQFDERLDKTRPPNFPLTDRYEVKEWES
ncbi:hypothetical protein GWO43_03750, partial [candidate division KSB1 bacterium]|nr:hypothetical protein [candidate division KSB1 bacterium]NIR70666.1 hypothetical protein [candidate division KSB1 bacterium]NIS23154.1 hypothetical protein [candidate division KSB1 bacterium]NIT70015.1 hypothetical protein [candidate division KSB1 bacterium]NIU23652.1 hypothetical protein [candidate division KSB1 bacterium]